MKRLLLAIAACSFTLPAAGVVELLWDFEAGIPVEYFETMQWAERDAGFTYGPAAPYREGNVWVGTPMQDLEQYPGLHLASLTTAEIDLAELGMASLYISWVQWGDFEGITTNFDGAQLLISATGGVSWQIIDDPPSGHLNPNYDAQIVPGGGTPISGKWAYCYDTFVADESPGPLPSYRSSAGDRPFQTADAVEIGWRAAATGDLIALGYATPAQSVMFRWLFASDALEGGQGYFIDDLRIADTPPDCEIPPSISVELLSDTPDTLGDYAVEAVVTRVCADVDPGTVKLHYWSDISDTATVTMLPAGGDDYSAEIPAHPLDTDIWYEVSAADVVGNRGRTPTHSFEVTEAITLILDDGQPYFIDPEFYAAGDGIAARFTAAVTADTTYDLHKLLCFFANEGRFDVGVWDDSGPDRAPGSRLHSSGPIGNDLNNGWWSYEFEDSTLQFSDGAHFYVGYTFATGDSLDNPNLSYDTNQDAPESSWRYIDNSWEIDNQTQKGDPLLRVKVKKRAVSWVNGGGADAAVPATLRVQGNYPNPFNPRTEIRYQLPAHPEPRPVRVTIFDLAGRAVALLVDSQQLPGSHGVTWDGNSEAGVPVSSGVYFYRVEAGNETATRKMVLLK